VVDDDLGKLLSIEERVRARRIQVERKRKLWVRAHGLLRELIGRYLDVDPRTLRFARQEHGKPMLLDAGNRTLGGERSSATCQLAKGANLSFSLSHSAQLALYAFTRSGEVGIDVQTARDALDEIALATRAFARSEVRRLKTLDPTTREQEFLKAWVRHEALLKYTGTGIGGGAPERDGGEAWISELNVGPRAAGAVAVEHQPSALRCWDFSRPGYDTRPRSSAHRRASVLAKPAPAP
jgi:4'-phosphopantetheinyl transferase